MLLTILLDLCFISGHLQMKHFHFLSISNSKLWAKRPIENRCTHQQYSWKQTHFKFPSIVISSLIFEYFFQKWKRLVIKFRDFGELYKHKFCQASQSVSPIFTNRWLIALFLVLFFLNFVFYKLRTSEFDCNALFMVQWFSFYLQMIKICLDNLYTFLKVANYNLENVEAFTRNVPDNELWHRACDIWADMKMSFSSYLQYLFK